MSRLTSKLIGDIRKPKRGQVIYRDDELTGFGLRVTKGSMAWIVETKTAGKPCRRTIARVEDLTPEQARKEARRILAEISANADDHDPTFKAPTLAEVLAAYIAKKRLRESTITNYRQVIKRYLTDWEPLPVTQISKELVFARHREPGDRCSGNYANMVMQVLRSMLYFAMENYETPDGKPIIAENPVSRLSKNQMWYRKRRRQGVIPDHKLSDWSRNQTTDLAFTTSGTDSRCRLC